MKPAFLIFASAAFAAAEPTVPAAPPMPIVQAPAAPAAAPEKMASKLAVGSTVSLDALTKGEWLKGGPPSRWEENRVYLFACWATWSTPSIAAIPHLNELSKTFEGRNFQVFGMNVWERNGKDPVVAFVKNAGDGISFPVSYGAKGGAFEWDWLVPAGVSELPYAFVVKDGKILLMCHPAKLTKVLIEALMKGGAAQEKALKGMRDEEDRQGKLALAMRGFSEASRKKDVEAMTKTIEEMKTLDPTNPLLENYQLVLLATKGDWPALETAITALPQSPGRAAMIFNTARTVGTHEAPPASLAKALADRMAPYMSPQASPTDWLLLSRLQWRTNDKDTAIASAQKAITATESEASKKMGISPLPYQRYLESLEKGTLPTQQEISVWMRGMVSGPTPAKTAK